MPELRFDDDINRVFLSDSRLSGAQIEFEARYATRPADVAILVEAEGEFTPTQLIRVRDAALDLEFVPGVVAVTSPFALRFPPGHPDHPNAPVLSADLKSVDVAERIAAFRDLSLGLAVPIDRSALMIGVAVDTAARPLDAALPEIEALVGELGNAGLRATVTGADVAGLEVRDGLAGDLARLNLIGAALVVVVGLALLRDWRLAAIAGTPALIGAATTLAMTVWLDAPVTVLSNVLPVLMLILGVANGIHLTAAILLPGFGLLCRALVPAPRVVGTRAGRFAGPFGTPALRAPRAVATLGVVALVVGAVGYATTEPSFPLHRNLPNGNSVGPAADRLAERFGGAFRVWVEMPPDASWSDLVGAVTAAEAAVPGAVLSEVALARWAGDPATRPTWAACWPTPWNACATRRTELCASPSPCPSQRGRPRPWPPTIGWRPPSCGRARRACSACPRSCATNPWR